MQHTNLRGKYHKTISPFYKSNVGAARKVFSHWLQKTLTHRCSSLFPIISRLGYRTNLLLGLGELLHVPFTMLINRITCCKKGFYVGCFDASLEVVAAIYGDLLLRNPYAPINVKPQGGGGGGGWRAGRPRGI